MGGMERCDLKMSEEAHTLSDAERRRWPRRRIELLIRCRREGDSGEGIYFTRNLSEGGLMFESPAAFPPAAALELGWYAPVEGSASRIRRYLALQGQVQWVRPIPEGQEASGSNRY